MVASTFTNKLWIFLLLFSLFLISCSNEAGLVEKARQIKKGMTKQEVTEIMGNPDKIDYIKSSFISYTDVFYYHISPPVFSDPIIVWFDNAGQVAQVSLPKGTVK